MSERTIWKYTIPVHMLSAMSTTIQHIPAGARYLTCAVQPNPPSNLGEIVLWYEIPDPDAEKVQHGFQLFGTGTGPIGDHLTYVGTTMHAGGSLVLHVYETSKVEQ